MRGFHDASYGDAFADVYDDWYADISDVGATTDTLHALAGDGPILELGVGTGRLAVPLAARGCRVYGIDTSAAMLAVMARTTAGRPAAEQVVGIVGDMVDDLPSGPFALVFVAYNTLFSLRSAERQAACLRAVAARLAPGGAFVVEAFVPDPDPQPSSGVTVRSLDAQRVVLSVNTTSPDEQLAEGQFVEFTEAGGVRLRPWSIRWATVEQLDAMAAAAGLVVAERWAAFDRSPFGPDSPRHVTVYRATGR